MSCVESKIMRKELQIYKESTSKMEFAIKQMLLGDIRAYIHMRDALKFIEEKRKEVENDRRIHNLPKLEDS